MVTNRKHWVISLCVILSLGMALPFCCHTDLSEQFSHRQEMQSHSEHGQHSDTKDCECGHEFVKDYQKNKKIVNTKYFPGLNAIDLFDDITLSAGFNIPSTYLKFQPGLLKHSGGPPLHLLLSVFLN